jgi:hypothetical protein
MNLDNNQTKTKATNRGERIVIASMVIGGLLVTSLFWLGGINTGVIYELDRELPTSDVVQQ